MKIRKIVALSAASLFAALTLGACSDADIASTNLSTASDNFEIQRRIVFFNGITDKYLLEIQGYCSIEADSADNQLEVTCKTGDDEYKKHFLGLSDNVSYFVEQIESANADPYHYRVVFKPETILPDIDMQTSTNNTSADPEPTDEG